MKHKTFDLYRCSALVWARLPYEIALNYRILMAKEAMLYYRKKATKHLNKNDKKYQKFVKKYEDSEDAKNWNQKLLKEIHNERQKNETNNNKK